MNKVNLVLIKDFLFCAKDSLLVQCFKNIAYDYKFYIACTNLKESVLSKGHT